MKPKAFLRFFFNFGGNIIGVCTISVSDGVSLIEFIWLEIDTFASTELILPQLEIICFTMSVLISME